MIIKQNQKEAKAEYTIRELSFLEMTISIMAYIGTLTSGWALACGYIGLFGQNEVLDKPVTPGKDLFYVGVIIAVAVAVFVLSMLAEMLARHLYGLSLAEKAIGVLKLCLEHIKQTRKLLIARCAKVSYYMALVTIVIIGVVNLLVGLYVDKYGTPIMCFISIVSGSIGILGLCFFISHASSARNMLITIEVVDENGKVLLTNYSDAEIIIAEKGSLNSVTKRECSRE